MMQKIESVLEALLRHIPSYPLWDLEALPIRMEEVFFPEPKGDVFCVFGLNPDFYLKLQSWLEGHVQRRLIFVEDRPGAVQGLIEKPYASALLSNPKVKIFFLETPLQVIPIATKIAWDAVLLQLEVVDISSSHDFSLFKKKVEEVHLAANLLLSDAADFGVGAMLNAKENSSRAARSILGLKDALKGIPAIVVGAGPSLEKHKSLLLNLKESAIVFSGGSALSKIGFCPHFSAAVDKDPLPSCLFPQSPFCFSARVNPETLALMKGEQLLAAESHFSFLNWVMGEESYFESGWTVGTLLVSLAEFLGCDPIVSVGMDYCYFDGRKYAFEGIAKHDALVQVEDQVTQEDWVMAISWLKEFQKKHPKTRFFNVGDGIEYFETVRLEDLDWKEQKNLDEKIQEKIQSLPLVQPRWDLWEESLCRVRSQLMNGEPLNEEEPVYQHLLEPQWLLWRPVFEREIEIHSHLHQIEMHRRLFFQTIVENHLGVL